MLPLPVVPSVVAQPRDAVASLARTVATESATSPRTAEERAAWLVGLRQIVDAAEATFTAVLTDFDSAGDGAERVRIARVSRDLLRSPIRHLVPEASNDLAAGPTDRLSFEQVRVIARSVRTLPPSSHDDAVSALTEKGTHVGVDDLRATARHLKQVIDPDGSLRQAETDFQRRWLTVAPMLDGMHAVEGVLDAESAALLNGALAPSAVPTGTEDRRTASQRRADGLTEIVTAAVKSGELPTLSGSSTALQVQVPLATLVGADGRPAQLLSVTASAPVWITGPTLGRVACDADVRRIVLDPSGVPVEMGRSVRVFTGPQRQALAARDAGCRFPGCDQPARHTDAHHLVAWTAGGLTTLTNGLLLCRYHHRQVHEGGWRIHPTQTSLGANGDLEFLGPDGQRLSSALPPRRAGPSPWAAGPASRPSPSRRRTRRSSPTRSGRRRSHPAPREGGRPCLLPPRPTGRTRWE